MGTLFSKAFLLAIPEGDAQMSQSNPESCVTEEAIPENMEESPRPFTTLEMQD
jgi:hypothetical protein